MKRVVAFSFAFFLLTSSATWADEANFDLEKKSRREAISELELFTIPYGFSSSSINTHVYISVQYLDYESSALGSYANAGSSAAGHSNIIPYSGYIDLSSQIRNDMKVEAEFELYKGDGLKICRLRGVWKPIDFVALSLGRDFGIIGLQEKLYYPTSKFKLFTIPPFLHMNVIRYTGWWDSGAFVYTEFPMTLFSSTGKVMLDASISNGPGISDNTKIATNAAGYMYEHFHDLGRQATDNNNDKPIAVRLSISPWKDFEFGGSYLNAKWDKADRHFAQYVFSHFLLNWEDLTLVSEYGQLKFGSPSNGVVTQFSGYIAAGYTILKDLDYIALLQPVVRYEILDSWKEDPTRKGYRESVSAGLRYSPFLGWVVKAAYQWTREPHGPALANNGFAGEVVYEF